MLKTERQADITLLIITLLPLYIYLLGATEILLFLAIGGIIFYLPLLAFVYKMSSESKLLIYRTGGFSALLKNPFGIFAWSVGTIFLFVVGGFVLSAAVSGFLSH